jgi:polyisoprenoid-binding protein YceI
MKKILLSVILGMATLLVSAQTWISDPAHSHLTFAVSHMTISEVTGNFTQFDVKVTATKPDHSDAKVDVTVQIASISTNVTARDNHLKTADFFDAATYPTMTFKSTSIRKIKGNNYKLAGNLTMHGVTKPIVLDVVYKGTVSNPMNKKETSGFLLKGKLNRMDYGIGPKYPATFVGTDIAISGSVEFIESK